MRRSTLPLLFGLACLPAGTAAAAPLDPTACEQLRQELVAADSTSARTSFGKGLDWAKVNLKPDQLRQIERLLEAEAQFLFRCPQPKRQFDAATEQVMENGTGSDPDPDAAKPTEAGAAAKPAPGKKAIKPKPAVAAASATNGEAQAAIPPAPKPKRAAAKPKPAADAFVPEAATSPAQKPLAQ